MAMAVLWRWIKDRTRATAIEGIRVSFSRSAHAKCDSVANCRERIVCSEWDSIAPRDCHGRNRGFTGCTRVSTRCGIRRVRRSWRRSTFPIETWGSPFWCPMILEVAYLLFNLLLIFFLIAMLIAMRSSPFIPIWSGCIVYVRVSTTK